jgi:pimeloyl-ACP methyl ester carboxylesterase
MRIVMTLCAIVLLLAGAGCAPTDGGSAAGPPQSTTATLAASPSPVSPSPPAPTDAAGKPIVRPYCAEPGVGRYLHVPGPTVVASVLILGGGPRGVVVGAQANGGICQMLAFGRLLAGQGYRVALFDWDTLYAETMITAAKALLADGASRVVLGGFSRGALVALGVAPALGAKVVGVFSISGGPSANEGFPTVASLSRYRGPILLVSGADDAVFPQGTTEAIAKAHVGPETVLIVPGGSHALGLLDSNDGTRVQAAIDLFLSQTLR